MSPQSHALLKLIAEEPEDSRCPSSLQPPAVDGGGRSTPSASLMARWRAEADAHMEDALARFDAVIIGGEDVSRAAHALTHGFMAWCRTSMGRFGAGPSDDEERRAWSREQAVWMGLADLAAGDASRDPAGVDRFLLVWLGVVHEATATGRAWLFSE